MGARFTKKAIIITISVVLLTTALLWYFEPEKTPTKRPQVICMHEINFVNGEVFFVDVLKNWKSFPTESAIHWINTKVFFYENDLCMDEYHDGKLRVRIMTNTEMKQYVEDIIRLHHGEMVVKTAVAKSGLLVAKKLVGSLIGSVADVAQFSLEYGGYNLMGKVVGAGGNIAYGALSGRGSGTRLIGGAFGLGLWLFSEKHLSSELTEDIYTM